VTLRHVNSHVAAESASGLTLLKPSLDHWQITDDHSTVARELIGANSGGNHGEMNGRTVLVRTVSATAFFADH
jgi:hypothetical protein